MRSATLQSAICDPLGSRLFLSALGYSAAVPADLGPIVGSHVYAVLSVGDDRLELYNPWGSTLTISADLAANAFVLVTTTGGG